MKSNSCGRNCIDGTITRAAIRVITACTPAGAPLSDSAKTIKEMVPAVQKNLSSFSPKGPKRSKIALITTSLNHS